MNPSRNAVNRTLLTGAALPAGGGRLALTSDPVAGRLPGCLSPWQRGRCRWTGAASPACATAP
ncbi:winged helix DNA-binding domain-containing protein, partial [Streptomyces anthocyanicus]